MSYTVTCEKKIGAFKAPNGEIMYIAFESTYDSNFRRGQPEWDCFAFGTYHDVMRTIYTLSSSCECGSLKTRSGDTTPENYIKSWLRAFKEPRAFVISSHVTFNNSKLTNDKRGKKFVELMNQILSKHGKENIVISDDEKFELRLDLNDDFQIIYEALSKKKIVYLSNFFVHNNCSHQIIEEYVPVVQCQSKTERTSQELIIPKNDFLFDGSIQYLQLEQDNYWKLSGTRYEIVSRFIIDHAYNIEIDTPGSSLKLISNLRAQLTNSPIVPKNAVVHVTCRTNEADESKVKYAQSLATNLAIETTGKFKFYFCDLNPSQKYHLYGLHSSQFKIEIPTVISFNQAVSQASTPSYVQFDFIQSGDGLSNANNTLNTLFRAILC